jgi:hypothetical protein
MVYSKTENALDMDSLCHEDGSAARKMLKILFLTPVLLPVQHTNETVMPLCNYLRANYTMIRIPSPETSGYGLWSLRSRSH